MKKKKNRKRRKWWWGENRWRLTKTRTKKGCEKLMQEKMEIGAGGQENVGTKKEGTENREQRT